MVHHVQPSDAPLVVLTTADFAGEDTERLIEDQVPVIPSNADRYEKHGYVVYDVKINGVDHRWRKRNGRLVTYLEYWPDHEARVESGKSPFRRLFGGR